MYYLMQGTWKLPNCSPLARLMDRCSLLPLRRHIEMLIGVRAQALCWVPCRLTEITATSAQQPTSQHLTGPADLEASKVASSGARPVQIPMPPLDNHLCGRGWGGEWETMS